MDADREAVKFQRPEGRQVCPQCERRRYIYTIPDIPPSLNKFAGRENVWA